MRPVLLQPHYLASAEDQALRLEVVGALLMLLVNISLICKICSLFAWINIITLGLGIEQMAASVEILLSLLVVLVVFKVQLCS